MTEVKPGMTEVKPGMTEVKPGMRGMGRPLDRLRDRPYPRKSLSVMAQTQESDQTFSAVSTMSMIV